jgi:hypothetical protein
MRNEHEMKQTRDSMKEKAANMCLIFNLYVDQEMGDKI